jgi:hypothetical protein
MQTLYTESWKLFIHEEVASQTKNTFFLSSQGAMLAILTGISGIFIKLPPYFVGTKSLYPGIFLLGLLSVAIGIVGIRINRHWKSVNFAHQAYQNLRWLTARAIEYQNNISDIGLASIEHVWRKHRDFSDEDYCHFVEIPELAEHVIKSNRKHLSYRSIESTIKAINVLWGLIILLGGLAAVGSCLSIFASA